MRGGVCSFSVSVWMTEVGRWRVSMVRPSTDTFRGLVALYSADNRIDWAKLSRVLRQL